jgi:hypothetical protein
MWLDSVWDTSYIDYPDFTGPVLFTWIRNMSILN